MRISDWRSDVCSSDLLSRDVEQGRYFLPNSATGHRETIITSPLRAEPEYLQIMPGPSVWPLFAAIFTAGFFVLMTIQAYGISLACGVLAIPCVLRWLWETRSEEHTSELQSLMRISYAVFCLKKKKKTEKTNKQ